MLHELLKPMNQCGLTGIERVVLFKAPLGYKVYRDNFHKIRIIHKDTAILFTRVSHKLYYIEESIVSIDNKKVFDKMIEIMQNWHGRSSIAYLY